MSNIDHPQHYNQGGMETIDIIRAALSPEEFMGFMKGNQIKYICRAAHKGNELEDAGKARWYAAKLEEVLKDPA